MRITLKKNTEKVFSRVAVILTFTINYLNINNLLIRKV